MLYRPNIYFAARQRRWVDTGLARAYQDKDDELLLEIENLLGDQAWPTD